MVRRRGAVGGKMSAPAASFYQPNEYCYEFPT